MPVLSSKDVKPRHILVLVQMHAVNLHVIDIDFPRQRALPG
jgi:hypothetical protein